MLTVIVILIALNIALYAGRVFVDSGAAGTGTPSADGRALALASRVTAPEKCPDARKAVRFYQRRYAEWRAKMGAGHKGVIGSVSRFSTPPSCPRYLASVWKRKAREARKAYGRWHAYHYDWPSWLPDKWQRIGACETGYGRRPGNWRHSNSSYEGAFGFAKSSWDAFKYRADPKAGPYPEDAWQATPRQQYEVALAIWRMYGFSGWGCRGA